MPRVLTVNPGSTSTKIALFEDEKVAANLELTHDRERLLGFARVVDQTDFRLAAVRQALAEAGVALAGFDAVVGRGGLLAPLPGGTYAVTEPMLDDLRHARHGEHPSNLGAILADILAREADCPAFIVDPVVTDELMDVARVTGLPEIERRSVFHALSQRGAARTAATRLGVRYEEENFLVAHLGGGISIGAHRRGQVVDVVNALDGEGPFSPERSGQLPLIPVLDLLERGRYSLAEFRTLVLTHGGLFALAGTNDLRQVEAMAAAGDARADLVLRGLAYHVAKHLASLAPAFYEATPGLAALPLVPIRAVVLTGGMARSAALVAAIAARVAFLAPVVPVTGLEELHVMAEGAARVLAGQAKAKIYRPAPMTGGGTS